MQICMCSASFSAEDIIRSQSVIPVYDKDPIEVPLSMFAELDDPKKLLNEIAKDYGMPIPDGMPDPEYLYELCLSASVYRELRRITTRRSCSQSCTPCWKPFLPFLTLNETI